MLEGGADIRYIQSMLGHARLDTTQIYTHVSISALKEVHARTHPHGGASVPPFPSLPVAVTSTPIEMATVAPTPVLSSVSTELEKCKGRDGREDQGPDDGGAPPLIPPKPPQSPSGLKYNTSNDLRELDSREVNDYGYRYFHTELGRWISRDPIGESGGVNLYAFIRNYPIFTVDVFGGYPLVIDVSSDWFRNLDNNTQNDLLNNYLGKEIEVGPPSYKNLTEDIAKTLAWLQSMGQFDSNRQIATDRLNDLVQRVNPKPLPDPNLINCKSFSIKQHSPPRYDRGLGNGYYGPSNATYVADLMSSFPTKDVPSLLISLFGLGAEKDKFMIKTTSIREDFFSSCFDVSLGCQVIIYDGTSNYEVQDVVEFQPLIV